MSKRYWRDFIASNDHGLWRGAIPQPPASAQGVKENFIFDLVMRLAKKEEDKERFGELLADAVAQSQVRVKLTDGKKTRRGHRPNASGDAKLVQEIRAKNPKSDEWMKFKNHLTSPSPGRLPVNVDTARRRYKKAVAILAKK